MYSHSAAHEARHAADWSIVLDRNRRREGQRAGAPQLAGGAPLAPTNGDVIDGYADSYDVIEGCAGAEGVESASFTLANLVVVWRFCGFVLANMVAVYALEYMITSGFLQVRMAPSLNRIKVPTPAYLSLGCASYPRRPEAQLAAATRAVGDIMRSHNLLDRQLGQQQPE